MLLVTAMEFDLPDHGHLLNVIPAFPTVGLFYAVRVGRNPGVYLNYSTATQQTVRYRHNLMKSFNHPRVAAAFVYGPEYAKMGWWFFNTAGAEPKLNILHEQRFIATAGPQVDVDCQEVTSIGDPVTQPFAAPAAQFYASERVLHIPETPTSTGYSTVPVPPTLGAVLLPTALAASARSTPSRSDPPAPIPSVAAPRTVAANAPSSVTASSADPTTPGFLNQRLPESLAVNEARPSSASTNYSDLIEDLSAQFECITTSDDGRVTISPFQRKTLSCPDRSTIQSSKYISNEGVEIMDRLRYDDIALAVVNDIYVKSFVDRSPSDGPNRVVFLCALWRAGWLDTEGDALDILNSMKPFSG